MKNITSHTGTLNILGRLAGSLNGNPRFEAEVDGIRFATQVDAMHGYCIQNYDGRKVTVLLGDHYNRTQLHEIIEPTK